jgi:hypothetical protein
MQKFTTSNESGDDQRNADRRYYHGVKRNFSMVKPKVSSNPRPISAKGRS